MPLPVRTLDRQVRLLEPVAAPPQIADPHPPGVRDDLRRLRESLAGTAAAGLTNAVELMRCLERTSRTEMLPTALAAFDALLGGGLPRGKMVELTGRRGRFSIALSAIAAATSMGEAAVLIDLGDHLDPQIAEASGADLRRVLWIRPETLRQAVMSAEMIIGAGFQLVVLDVGLHPIRGRRVSDASWVRLGRAAEAHGAALLVSAPYSLSGTASEAVVHAGRSRMNWAGRGRAPRLPASLGVELQLEKHRHRRAGVCATLVLIPEDAAAPGVLPLGEGGSTNAEGRRRIEN